MKAAGIVLLIFAALALGWFPLIDWFWSLIYSARERNLARREVGRHKLNRRPSLLGRSRPRRKLGQPAVGWFMPYQRHQTIRDVIGGLADRMDALMTAEWEYSEVSPLRVLAKSIEDEPVTVSWSKVPAYSHADRSLVESETDRGMS